MPTTDTIFFTKPNVLVGNALYWLFTRGDILVFDLRRQRLGVIQKPADAHISNYYYPSVQVLRTADSGLGLAYVFQQTIQLWERRFNCDGVGCCRKPFH